jgi:hypothetical protein
MKRILLRYDFVVIFTGFAILMLIALLFDNWFIFVLHGNAKFANCKLVLEPVILASIVVSSWIAGRYYQLLRRKDKNSMYWCAVKSSILFVLVFTIGASAFMAYVDRESWLSTYALGLLFLSPFCLGILLIAWPLSIVLEAANQQEMEINGRDNASTH